MAIARLPPAARGLDHCLGILVELTAVGDDTETLLIVMADHGGGGTTRREHDSDHPLNRTIPIVLAGGAVQATRLLPDSSLIDVLATVLFALGVAIPDSYERRPLREAFQRSWDDDEGIRSCRWMPPQLAEAS